MNCKKIFLYVIVICCSVVLFSCSEDKVVCPGCHGSGQMRAPGIIVTMQTCGFCDGTGRVLESEAEDIRRGLNMIDGMFPSSNDEDTAPSNSACAVCKGTGRCYHCAGRGELNGAHGPYDCGICHGSGECHSCYGTGRR